MILVENSSFGPAPDTNEYSPSYQNSFQSYDSRNITEPFIDLDDIDQILLNEASENKTIDNDCYFDNEDEDSKFLELSDSGSQGQPDQDLSTLTPSVHRLFCHTSMSNYSTASSAETSILYKSCNELQNSAYDPYYLVKSNQRSNNFGQAFDSVSSYGSGSNTSSAPSTPSSTVGGVSNAFSYQPGIPIATLPSFQEIYSPRKYKTSFDTGPEFFKFEDYISESESDAESNNNISALNQKLEEFSAKQGVSEGGSTVHQPQIVFKEEPMDSFLPTTSNSMESIFQQQNDILVRQDSFNQLMPVINKAESEKEYDIYVSSSPKPLREHMINLSGSPQLDQLLASSETELVEPMRSQSSMMHIDQIMQSSNVNSPIPSSNISLLIDPTTIVASESSAGMFRNKVRNQRHKSSQMQTCAVCGDVAACQHYGVLTCEGCKGFFKRTVQKSSKYNCLGNQDCTVDKRRRNRCQFCRFKKCLAVGMVKEVVRTDNLKGRRGRLPSKPKSPQEQPISPPMSTIAALVKAHEETSADNANLDFSKFYENIEERIQLDNQVSNYINQQILSLLSNSLDILMPFVEKIPGFNELNENDRKLLFQNSSLELFALRMAYRRTPGTNFVILCNNKVLHRKQFAHTLGDWLLMIEELSNQLYAMKIDVNAFACLCALTVISGRHGVQDIRKIDQLETKITNSLKDHTVYNSEAQKKTNYFSKILLKLSELRTIGEIGYRSIMEKMNELPTELITPEICELERKILPKISNDMASNIHLGNLIDLPSMSSFSKPMQFTKCWSPVN